MRWLQRGGIVGAALCLLPLLGTAPTLWAADPGQGPRSISEAERRAVELAALYLDQGPEAWLPELAAASPLRELGPAAAVAEIGVRAGPPGEAVWHLETPTPGTPDGMAVFALEFPSGVEDVLTLTLARDRGGWRIASLRSLADPEEKVDDAFWRESPQTGRSAPPAPGGGAVRSAMTVPATLAALGLFLALVAGSASAGRRRIRAAGLVAGAGLAVLLALACGRGAGGPEAGDRSASDRAGSAGATGSVHLGSLRDLRWATAAGRDREVVDRLYQQVEAAGGPELVTQIANLWRAETLMSQVDLHEAEAALAAVPSPAPVPLGQILRARLAYVRSDLDTTGQLYQKAETSGADSERLRLEAAQALTTLGLYDQAEVEFTQLAEMGSRQAEVYYFMARYSAVADKDEEGEGYLRLAWRLAPMMRERLFGDPLLSHLCARPTLFPLFEFDRPEEPVVEPERLASRPVELPAGARVRLLGEDLEIDVGGGRLEVPAGAELAPQGVTRENAGDRRRREEERTLSRLPSLLEVARSPEVLAQPRRRQEVVDASVALARHNRWQELVELTDEVSKVLDRVPSSVVQLRAAALDHTGRAAEARTLLVALAKHLVAGKRRDPGTFYQLAELFASSGQYDLAIRLIRRAAELAPLYRNDQRIRQISLEKWLYEAPERLRTRHFEIVYPHLTGARYADELGQVLEAERTRLSRWIPDPEGERHRVNLFPLVQFLRAYSENVLVLGVYDDRIRVPFADLRSLHPQLVSILSHELAHSMIGQATHDQAPHWFQEGLAQHVEMLPGRINPIPDLQRTGRVIAFPMIEPILRGFSEPQLVDLAYGEAAWVIHYIEAEHGVAAIHHLIEAFARGRTTEEALQDVFGMSVPQFDQAVWRWCLKDAPASWPTELRRYDRNFDHLVQASKPARLDGSGSALRSPVGTPKPQPGRAPAAGAREQGPRTMKAWYAIYAARVKPFKETLGAILGPLQSGDRMPRAQCAVLAGRLAALRSDRWALRSPDVRINQDLGSAFEKFGGMVEACTQGSPSATRAALADAEAALGRAARDLAPYGLRP